MANNFGASYGHEVRKAEDLVKGDEMCRAFSMALLRHIDFSQGAFHMDDLNMIVDEPEALEFSYNLGNSLLKFNKKKKVEDANNARRNNTKNFEELEKKIIQSEKTSSPSVDTPSIKRDSPHDEEEVQEEIAEFLSDKEEVGGEKSEVMKYEDIEGKKEELLRKSGDLDFDYTETQLEEFLASCKCTHCREPEGEQTTDEQSYIEFHEVA